MYANRTPIRRTIRVGRALCLLLLPGLMVVTAQAADPVIGQPFLIDSGITSATAPVVAAAHNTNRN